MIVGFELGVAFGEEADCGLEPLVGYVEVVGLWTLQRTDG